MIEVNFESFIQAIVKTCGKHLILSKIITPQSDIGVTYNRGSISHIWVHGVTSLGVEHRVAYEQDYRTKVWQLNHYMWKNGKGWTFIGTIKSDILSHIKLANLK